MNTLDRLLPAARLREINQLDLAARPDAVWAFMRHADLAESLFVRALIAIRTLPSRLVGRPVGEAALRIDDMVSTQEQPGFRILIEAPREVAVGAIGKVWQGDIPFVHVDSPEAFAVFSRPDFIKVAWAIRVLPLGERYARVEVEVRVDPTDEEAWRKFKRYFRVIGIGSHFIRRSFLRALTKRFGDAKSQMSASGPAIA